MGAAKTNVGATRRMRYVEPTGMSLRTRLESVSVK